mmetsp:Transcript_47515/g.90720  ORF Transcript_47515/g.90720 Transcript_47515/m.90720 type:complete len:135 (+) Transcript_47515:151-555(+)
MVDNTGEDGGYGSRRARWEGGPSIDGGLRFGGPPLKAASNHLSTKLRASNWARMWELLIMMCLMEAPRKLSLQSGGKLPIEHCDMRFLAMLKSTKGHASDPGVAPGAGASPGHASLLLELPGRPARHGCAVFPS